MVYFLTKVLFGLIALDQILFIYQLWGILSNSLLSPLTIINYAFGLITIGILIVRIYSILNGYSRYLSFLLILPVINVFVVPYLSYKLTSSKILASVTFAIWFANLFFTLLSNIPPVIYFDEGSYFLSQFIILDLLSLASLLSITFCILYRERRRN